MLGYQSLPLPLARVRFPLDHRQHRGDQPTHVGRRQQGSRPGLFLRHDHHAPELHRGVGQGLDLGGDDAVPKGDNPGQRVLTLSADLRALDRGAAAGPSGVKALEVEQAFCQRGRRGPPVYAPSIRLTLPSNKAPGSISRVS